jgi:DNA-3-methyladenine glycosylase II
MPATRSSTRSLSQKVTEPIIEPKKAPAKRKAAKQTPEKALKKAKTAPAALQSAQDQAISVPARSPDDVEEEMVPAILSFSFEDAKKHLIAADPRFKDMFERVPCKPFEHLEQLLPFR